MLSLDQLPCKAGGAATIWLLTNGIELLCLPANLITTMQILNNQQLEGQDRLPLQNSYHKVSESNRDTPEQQSH